MNEDDSDPDFEEASIDPFDSDQSDIDDSDSDIDEPGDRPVDVNKL